MSTGPTNYHPLEPTQPGYYNPYAYYGDVPPIPPPPPKQKSHRGLFVTLASSVGLLLIVGVVFGVVVRANFQPAVTPTATVGTQMKPTVAPTATAAVQNETATGSAVTPTLTTANSNYAADDIYNDMLENNLPINSHYENAEFNLQNTAWGSVDVAWQPTSGMLLNDASVGFGGGWPMGLYVFASKDQAYEDAQSVKANASQVYVSTHGRCLLVADSQITDFSQYAAIVTQYCI